MFKKISILFICVMVSVGPVQTWAQATATTEVVEGDSGVPLGTVDCFDYYKFGSVQVEFSAGITETVPGTPITFTGRIINNNSYPVTDGRLLIKIFKERNSSVKDPNGPDVVDEFVVMDKVAIKGNDSVPLKFLWTVPYNQDDGSYKAVAFFITNKKFNLLGLSFTDDIIGNTTDFKISGQNKVVRFDKEGVKINGRQYYFATFPPRVQKEEIVTITAVLKNDTVTTQSVPVNWDIYNWDGMQEENLLEQYSQVVNVPPKSSIEVSYIVKNTTNGVYYVRLKSGYEDTKSILGIRFVRDGIGSARINFPSITSFPLVKDQKNTVFSCFHINNDLPIPSSGTLKLTLKDMKDNIIHAYKYDGFITSTMMGIKDDFVPLKNYKNVKLIAELYEEGVLTDSVEIIYACEDLELSGCKIDWVGWGGLIIVLLCGLFLIIQSKRRDFVMVLLLCAGGAFTVSISPQTVSAKEIQWNTANIPGLATSFGSRRTKLQNINVTVTYKATVATEEGVPLNGGEVLPVGSKIKITATPHVSNDIYWFGMGSVYDSPYGEWRVGATPPTTGCQNKDFTTAELMYGIKSSSGRYMYFPLVISPPNKSLSNIQNLTCEPLVDGKSTCTVTGSGPVSVNLNFAPTTGHFYFSYIDGVDIKKYPSPSSLTEQQKSSCEKMDTPLGDYTVQVPAQNIMFGFSANSEANQPPADPTISGPAVGSPNQTYTFSVKSTDPDNDKVKYGIVWGGAEETINEWAPSSGYVEDNTDQVFTRTWTVPGTYTFKVKTFDERGLFSGWATHTITISDIDKCTNVLGKQNAASFSAHGREYFYSSADGTLYFASATAASSGNCTIDMCADTSQAEAVIPPGYGWDLSGLTDYEKYSCVAGAVNCACSGRALECTSDSGVSTTPNAPQCSLQANCSYSIEGDRVVFDYFVLNARGVVSPTPSRVSELITNDGGPISGTRQFTDSFDGTTALATCEFPNDSSITEEVPKDPKIVSFIATPIVEQGRDCRFSWTTQDMSSCSLGGEDFGVQNSAGTTFGTSAGRNITKTLTCTTDEGVDSVQRSLTKTCFVRPTVTPF